MKVELILEGGGMRGAYTCGVLDFFIDNDVQFKDITAVSAGVASGLYYVTKQRGIGIEILTQYSQDKRYLSVENFIKSGSIFGLDFIFKTIPEKILPFDFDAFNNSNINLIAVSTNVKTGKPHYELIDKLNDKIDYVIASASLPIVSRIVKVDGLELLDGGASDSIPIKRSVDLFDRHVLVLTRNAGYRKRKRKSRRLTAIRYPFRHEFREVLKNRHIHYNESLDLAERLEEEGKAIIIRPSRILEIDRFEKDPEKLLDLYNMGYMDAKSKYQDIINMCNECENIKFKK